ncbi:putative phage tail protein [Bradyrhizobium sp. BRP23]|uniref:YmfQ family protein n=1 Tax=Bradyrhizobium sp. BRP23 TaxID=2793820 RepID=UPI001CD3871C|nr:putative phage tail protein [Bradyrhizobium sp. BRP23]MCA1419500.1 DUF2313 domain-containing protein [Bradyrhizobium sp. BRP23]
MDQHVTRTGDDYAEQLAKLLPRGQAWPTFYESTLQTVVRGLAQVWGDFELRASLLLEQESDPRSTIELLPDWERNWGLPDPCYKSPQSIADRQRALVQRMTIEGAQSRAFFIDIAAQIGYTITITEYRPFMVGIDRVGDNRVIGDGSHTQLDYLGRLALDPTGVPPDEGEYSEYPYILGPDSNRWYWTVHVGTTRLTWFRCSAGQCGVDPHLIIALAEDLECLLNRWKPAHTQIIFDYSGLSTGGPMAGTP